MLAMLDGSSDQDEGDRDSAQAAATALSVHGFLAGAAPGPTEGRAAKVVLFIALVAHKGAASFSLSSLLAEGSRLRAAAIVVQGFFVLALPVGMVLSAAIFHDKA